MASLNPISGVLGFQRAGHLLRRATFGPDISTINTFAAMTIQDAMDALLQEDPEPAPPVDPVSGTDWIYPNTQHPDVFNTTLSGYTCSWWMENARASGVNLTERMIWFYYTHFPMIMSRIEFRGQFAVDYLRLLRYYALGNYKELTKALCIDNAMLVHLDGNLNIKSVPQENFAREFLELFTVGKGEETGVGNYTTFTEQDVQMATKVLTGWGVDGSFQTIDAVTGIPTGKVKGSGTVSSQHDITSKQFSSAFNNTVIETSGIVGANAQIQSVYDELDEFISMIFDSPHTARNICRRIYREFVYFDITPEIENDIIEPLANTLRANDYEISSVLQVLLQSEHFYDEDTLPTNDDNIGAIIKSPMDLVIGSMRLFELQVPDRATDLEANYQLYGHLIHELSLQGLEIFEPYDVAGHDPYFQLPDFQRYWISSNYLANRYKFIEHLLVGIGANGNELMRLDFVQFVRDNCSDPANATTLVQELVDWLLPITLSTDRFNYFKDAVLLDQLSEINWSVEWSNYMATNNDANVRLQLEALALAMMQSPEYQLY